MQNPNDVVQNKHIDALSARVAGKFDDILGGASTCADFDAELDDIFITGGASTCVDFDTAIGNIFGTGD